MLFRGHALADQHLIDLPVFFLFSPFVLVKLKRDYRNAAVTTHREGSPAFSWANSVAGRRTSLVRRTPRFFLGMSKSDDVSICDVIALTSLLVIMVFRCP